VWPIASGRDTKEAIFGQKQRFLAKKRGFLGQKRVKISGL
jgi:hypothetical protein